MSHHRITSNPFPNGIAAIVQSQEDLARLYITLGWSLLPIHKRSKVSVGSWKHRQSSRARLDEVLEWIRDERGIGVVLGEISGGWVCRDFDDADAYRVWAAAHPRAAKSLPTSQTGRGFHVFAKSDSQVKTIKFADGELRSDGSYVVIAPSVHPDGGNYRWLTAPANHSPISVVAAGLCQAWSGGVASYVTERTEAISSGVSVLSVTCDKPVTVEHHELIMAAIDETVPSGVGGRNDGLFKFARKIAGILGGQPSRSVLRKYALLWYHAAKPKIATLDPGVTIADLQHAIERVKKPDNGEPLLERVMRAALKMDQPTFVADLDEGCASVRLAKLVVALSRESTDEVFYLSCRSAAQVAGFASHVQASRVLKSWVHDGILQMVSPGKSGPPGSKASRYRLTGANRPG